MNLRELLGHLPADTRLRMWSGETLTVARVLEDIRQHDESFGEREAYGAQTKGGPRRLYYWHDGAAYLLGEEILEAKQGGRKLW